MNKGFTLVELIAVITIIAIIAIITTPAYDTISKNIKKTNYESKQNTIKAQTLAYVEKYMKNDVYNGGESTNDLCFTVEYLIENGIISSDSETEDYIENNVTGEKYRGNQKYIKVYYNKESLKLNAITLNDDNIDEFNNIIDCN